MLRPLPGVELQAHVAELLRAGWFGSYVLCGFLLVLGVATGLAFPYPSIAAVVGGFPAIGVVCRRGARGGGVLDRLILLRLGGSIVLMTALIHLFGCTDTGIATAAYVLLLFDAAPLLSRAGGLLLANMAALAYGVILIAERTGWLRSYAMIGDVPSDGSLAAVLAGGNCVLLNLYVSHARRVGDSLEEKSVALERAHAAIRRQAEELQAMVAVRTRERAQRNDALSQQARAREEMRELETVVYGITHDLKAPLNGIALTARAVAARERNRLTSESAEDVAWIATTAQHGERILADLLSMFQLTTAAEVPQAVDLAEMAAEIVAALRARAGGRRIRVRLAHLPPVWGKPRKLRQALLNVLMNAVDYTPADTGEISVTGFTGAGTVTVCVEDNGPGIPEDYRSRIFELFARVPDPERPPDAPAGSGVGLALVQRIVAEHQGDVRVDCPPHGGSCFAITLRTASTADARPPAMTIPHVAA